MKSLVDIHNTVLQQSLLDSLWQPDGCFAPCLDHLRQPFICRGLEVKRHAHVIFVLFRPNTSVHTCFASFFSPISLCSSSSSRHLLIPWNTVEHQGSKLHNYPLYGFHHFSPPIIFHLHASQSTALSTDCKQLMYTNWQLIMQQSYSTTVTVDAAVNVAAHGQMKSTDYSIIIIIIAVGVTKWCN